MQVQDIEEKAAEGSAVAPADEGTKPIVFSYSPTSGPTTGGTTVTFNGIGFRPRTQIFFGQRESRLTIFISQTQIIAVTPRAPGPGFVDILLRNPSGRETPILSGFRYVLAGIIGGGPDGILDKAQLAEMSMVDEDGPITVNILDSDESEGDMGVDQAQGLVPLPDPGDIDLKAPPVITSVTPNSGLTNGGTVVRIVGDNFKAGTMVLFGTTPAQRVMFINKQNLEAVSPVHVAGNVKVRVVNPSGLMAELRAGFTYVMAPAPIITSISPTSGPSFGNFGIQVNGANFAPGCQILFGFAIGPANYVNPFVVGFTCPPGSPGTVVSVGVRNPDGQQFIANGAFRYEA
jgi:hypothetical protein